MFFYRRDKGRFFKKLCKGRAFYKKIFSKPSKHKNMDRTPFKGLI